ncbi:DNA-dependent metalloprotease WSS1 isoform X1 [Tripterygium wilfordii]|uniref:DNA-dependent metalloprotease WSS1 isoform X1 n=1 Tax=Tripterygium wilfordii TaxID=458696 RepID=UPI0018F83723|nr:DNA-dependent metalloprotease WSS1 isoform X1 [Tripterygium wilfordii]
MDLGDLNKVWEVRALKRKPADEEARKMLEKIAKQVQPIMRKHKWRVKLLSEFCPNNPSLLGLNVGGGVEVKLRLRRPNRDWDFFPYDQVLDTMLHELCHNVHGPHNAQFYKLWDELRKECEELISKGVTGTGEGFDLPGRRLGGFSRQPPLSSLHRTALAAAENRARLGSLMPSGPRRLGGDSTIKDVLSPIQAAAMAAERRLQDDIWCGSHSSEVSEEVESVSDISEDVIHVGQHSGSSRQHSISSANALDATSQKRNRESDYRSCSKSSSDCMGSNFVDLSVDASISGSSLDYETNAKKRSCKSLGTSISKSNNHLKPGFVDLSSALSSGSIKSPDATQNQEKADMWQCAACTLLNPALAPICELCGTQKPKEFSMKYKTWSCKFCTLENNVKLDKCSACDQWRYSYGAPISTRSPNVGT